MSITEKHHLAWLSAHPQRNEAWLADRLADGFDVHHLDGDHSNNDHNNLALVEHTDHIRLHGVSVPSVPLWELGRQARASYEASDRDYARCVVRGEGKLHQALKKMSARRRGR